MSVQGRGATVRQNALGLSLIFLGNHGDGRLGSKNTGKAGFEMFSNLEEIWVRNLRFNVFSG